MTRNNTHPAATGVESSSSGGGNVGSDPANPSRLMSSSSSRHLSHRHLSGELRDLARPIRPSWVVPCAVTTVHPQLRDLVACPRGRGELFVVEGKGVKRVVVDVAARTSSRAYARGGRDGESSESDNEDGEEEPEEDGWDDSSTSGATSGTRRSTLLWTPPQAGDEYMIWDQDGEGDDEDAIEHGDDDASTVGVRRGVMGGYVGGNAHHGRSKRGHHGGGRRHGGHADSRSIGQAGLRHDTRASSNRSGGEGRGGMYWTPNARQSTICNLSFTPNCITASDRLLACGGQNGELYLATLPSADAQTSPAADGALEPAASASGSWSLSMTLPHTSINNSFLLLPPYAGGTPLPTRPSSPVPGGMSSSSPSSSASRGNGVATYPNSLPTSAGGSGSRASHRFAFTAYDSANTTRYRSTSGAGALDDRDRDPRGSGQTSSGMATGLAGRSARVDSHPYPRPPLWATGTTFATSREDDILGTLAPVARTSSWEPRLLVSNNDQSIKMFAVRSSSGGAANSVPARWGDVQQQQQQPQKKLARVGGVRLQTAVNHTSMSPDGKTMLAVGDTNDVHLFEAIGGGREFRKIGTYKGSNDAGFSTSWSKDGRKFAVASQDGQVTVWDHRSSAPLAFLYTSPVNESSTSLAGPTASYWDEINNDGYPDVYYSPPPEDRDREERRIGEASAARVRRDPARAVKFSPEGSDRDLLVFSEEMDHIHIVDARTFATQETIRVPFRLDDHVRLTRGERVRQAVQNGSGRVGISGLAFDPTGDFLYTGTEATLVEFDLRATRKRGIGCSAMA